VNEHDRSLAEAVVRRLCEGAQIDGVRFGPVLQLLISDHGSGKPPIRGQVYLNLSSKWALCDPSHPLPAAGTQLLELTQDDALRVLCSIRERVIDRVDLAAGAPHLRLTLEGGSVLFVNGEDPQYEPWDMGVALGDPSEVWKVVACPGGGLAVWAPQHFTKERAG
jgi:hypothetical protein